MWNSLTDWVVSAHNTNIFKNSLDDYWQHQDIVYDFRHRHKKLKTEVNYKL